jgi:autotransporter family porin
MSFKMKPRLQKSALAQAIAITSLGLGASQAAVAVSCTNPLATTINTSCTVGPVVDQEITNSGIVNADETYAVLLTTATGVFSGSLINAGEIYNTPSMTPLDAVFGVKVGSDDLGGDITNTGSIDVSLAGPANPGPTGNTAAGIYVSGDILDSSTVTNSGEIDVSLNGTGTGTYANVYGIHAGGEIDGTITNGGEINVSMSGNVNNAALGFGIYAESDITGAVTNSGTISVLLSGTAGFGGGGGIYAEGNINGNVTNAGTIEVTLNDVMTSYAGGAGISADNNFDGTITNTSDAIIDVSLIGDTGAGYAEAAGIYVGFNADTNISGSIVNEGVIAIEVSGKFAGADAVGIEADGYDLSGTITNTGEISVISSLVGGESEARGIEVSGLTETGAINNEGDIEVFAWDDARGIVVDNWGGSGSGSILNDGSIVAVGSATDADVKGIDIDVLDSGGSLVNNGSIIVLGLGTYADVRGIDIDSLSGGAEFTNNGLIFAHPNPDSAPVAVRVDEGVNYSVTEGQFTNSSTGEIFGAVVLDDGADPVNMVNEGQWTLFSNNNGAMVPGNQQGYISGDFTQSGNGVVRIHVEDDDYIPSAASAVPSGSYGTVWVDGTADFSGQTGQPFRVVAPSNGLFIDIEEGDYLTDVFTAGSYIDRPPVGTDVGNGLWAWEIIENEGNDYGLDFGFTGYRGAANLANGQGGAYAGLGGVVDACVADLLDGGEGDSCVIFGGEDPHGIDTLLSAFGRLDTQEEVTNLLAQASASPNGLGASLNAITGASRVLGDIMDTSGTTGGFANLGPSGSGLAAGDGYDHTSGVWVRPYYIDTDQDRTGNGAWGYDAETTGVLVGADTLLNDCWRVGFGFGYSSTDVDGKDVLSQNHTEAETWQILAYGKYAYDERTYLDLLASYGWSDNDTRRYIDFRIPDLVDRYNERLKGDFDSWFAHAEAQLGRTYDLSDCWRLIPELGLSYTHYDQSGFTETGGNWALDVDDMDEDILTATFDLGTAWAPRGDDLVFSAYAGVGYDIMDADNVVDATFVVGSPGFQTEGVERDEFSVRGGVGVRTVLAEAFDVSLNYDVDGRDDYLSQMGSLNLRYMF